MKYNNYTNAVYQLLVKNPPIDAGGRRRMGATAYEAFWHGYDGLANRFVYGSTAHAAFRAGRHYAKINPGVY